MEWTLMSLLVFTLFVLLFFLSGLFFLKTPVVFIKVFWSFRVH